MSLSQPVIIAIGPARGLVGGITRHIQLLAEVAKRLSLPLEHFEIGRRKGEPGGIALCRRLMADYLALISRLRSLKAAGQPAVVHVNSSIKPVCVTRDVGFVLIARALGVPTIFQVHGCLLQGRGDGRLTLRWAARRALACADRVVVLSPAQAQAIGGRAARRAIALNNALAMMPLAPAKPALSPALRVLFLSRLAPEKGVMMCLEAMRRLRQRGVDVQLELAGDGPLLAELPERIREMGLDGFVRLTGFVSPEATRAHLLNADLMWLPSLVPEGQPYAMIEALEAGVPVVTTRAGAVVGEMIDRASVHGGPLIETAASAGALSDVTAALAADPERLAYLKGAARSLAEAVYSMEAVLPQWASVWAFDEGPGLRQ